MRRRILKIFLALILYSISFSPIASFAIDTAGCLTCHRYPGLVKFEKSDKSKALHIDEERHLLSSHKNTECRQCHTKITRVPHTDITEVECTTSCHSEDKDKINNLGKAYLSDFHKDEIFAITQLDDESSCRVCHPLYPHSSNNKVRALLNMHTGFMLCEVCHLRKDYRDNLVYDWREPEEFKFTGEPYGTHQKQEVKQKDERKSVILSMLKIFSKGKETQETPDIRYVISRIASYKMNGGVKTLFTNTHDNTKALNFLKTSGEMGPDVKKKELDSFHHDIARKEISVACDECHSLTGMLDFRKLGFDENRTKDLQYLNIKNLVTKYEIFYFPNLFGPRK